MPVPNKTAFGLTLPLTKGSNGYFNQSFTVIDQIKSNLKNLLLTRKGERVMQPTFGSDLHKVTFEPSTDIIKQKITEYIDEAVALWMPYINIENLEIAINEDTNNITVKISFSVLNSVLSTNFVIISF